MFVYCRFAAFHLALSELNNMSAKYNDSLAHLNTVNFVLHNTALPSQPTQQPTKKRENATKKHQKSGKGISNKDKKEQYFGFDSSDEEGDNVIMGQVENFAEDVQQELDEDTVRDEDCGFTSGRDLKIPESWTHVETCECKVCVDIVTQSLYLQHLSCEANCQRLQGHSQQADKFWHTLLQNVDTVTHKAHSHLLKHLTYKADQFEVHTALEVTEIAEDVECMLKPSFYQSVLVSVCADLTEFAMTEQNWELYEEWSSKGRELVDVVTYPWMLADHALSAYMTTLRAIPSLTFIHQVEPAAPDRHKETLDELCEKVRKVAIGAERTNKKNKVTIAKARQEMCGSVSSDNSFLDHTDQIKYDKVVKKASANLFDELMESESETGNLEETNRQTPENKTSEQKTESVTGNLEETNRQTPENKTSEQNINISTEIKTKKGAGARSRIGQAVSGRTKKVTEVHPVSQGTKIQQPVKKPAKGQLQIRKTKSLHLRDTSIKGQLDASGVQSQSPSPNLTLKSPLNHPVIKSPVERLAAKSAASQAGSKSSLWKVDVPKTPCSTAKYPVSQTPANQTRTGLFHAKNTQSEFVGMLKTPCSVSSRRAALDLLINSDSDEELIKSTSKRKGQGVRQGTTRGHASKRGTKTKAVTSEKHTHLKNVPSSVQKKNSRLLTDKNVEVVSQNSLFKSTLKKSVAMEIDNQENVYDFVMSSDDENSVHAAKGKKRASALAPSRGGGRGRKTSGRTAKTSEIETVRDTQASEALEVDDVEVVSKSVKKPAARRGKSKEAPVKKGGRMTRAKTQLEDKRSVDAVCEITELEVSLCVSDCEDEEQEQSLIHNCDQDNAVTLVVPCLSQQHLYASSPKAEQVVKRLAELSVTELKMLGLQNGDYVPEVSLNDSIEAKRGSDSSSDDCPEILDIFQVVSREEEDEENSFNINLSGLTDCTDHCMPQSYPGLDTNSCDSNKDTSLSSSGKQVLPVDDSDFEPIEMPRGGSDCDNKNKKKGGRRKAGRGAVKVEDTELPRVSKLKSKPPAPQPTTYSTTTTERTSLVKPSPPLTGSYHYNILLTT